MNEHAKHWMDIGVAIAYVLATVATPMITFITASLGAIWYGIRIYEWAKGRYNANVRND